MYHIAVLADSLCVIFKNVIVFTSCVHLQSTLPPKRCVLIATTTLFACRVLDELRWFGTTSITVITVSSEAPSPLRYVLPYLYRLYYLHSSSLSIPSMFQSQMLQVVSVYVSVTLSFFPPSLSLADSWLVWRHQTACIFSAATDGAMAACQRPECSLSQLSGRSPGPKWISSTLWGGAASPLPIEVFNCVFWHG